MRNRIWLRLYEFYSPKIYIAHRRLFKVKSIYRILGIRTKYRRIVNKYLRTKSEKDFSKEGQTVKPTVTAGVIEVPSQVTDNQKKRVALCIGSLEHGGAERQWVLLSIGFKLLGYSPVIVIQQNLNEASNYYMDLINKYELEVISLSDLRDFKYNEFNFALSQPIPVFTEAAIRELNLLLNESENILRTNIKFFEENCFDLVISALDYANVFVGISALINRFPRIIISFRAISPAYYKNALDFEKIYKEVIENDKVSLTSNSQHGAESYREYFGTSKKIELIENCEMFEVGSSEKVCSCNKFHVLGFMRLSKEKNPLLWLKVCEDLYQNSNLNFHFILSGSGVLLAEVRAKVLELKFIGLNIDLIYSQNPGLYFNSLKGALLVSSMTEGQSNLIAEAKFYDFPIITLNELDKLTVPDDPSFEYNLIETLRFIELTEKLPKSTLFQESQFSVEVLKNYAQSYLNVANVSSE
jgi:hypothetical protein